MSGALPGSADDAGAVPLPLFGDGLTKAQAGAARMPASRRAPASSRQANTVSIAAPANPPSATGALNHSQYVCSLKI
jgi:hypothetical protein